MPVDPATQIGRLFADKAFKSARLFASCSAAAGANAFAVELTGFQEAFVSHRRYPAGSPNAEMTPPLIIAMCDERGIAVPTLTDAQVAFNARIKELEAGASLAP